MQNGRSWMFLLITIGLIVMVPVGASAELADILYEKGILDKEEYEQAKAESEKLEEAEDAAMSHADVRQPLTPFEI